MLGVANLKSKSVPIHDYSMNPSRRIPRSKFNLSHKKLVPMNFSDLVPILCRPVLPGDTWNIRVSVSARTATPIVPILDNWRMEFFGFYCPMRILWTNARKFWGEQDAPGDSINYTMPQGNCSQNGGFAVGSLMDYLGLPTIGQYGAGNALTYNSLPIRGAAKIWNDWFRDENLQAADTYGTNVSDGPDTHAYNLACYRRGKRFDQLTQALPWPQKGSTAITLPIGTTAPVIGVAGQPIFFLDGGGANKAIQTTNASTAIALSAAASGSGGLRLALSGTNVVCDLSSATGPTINSMRNAIAMQQFLEADARGGTRYNEYVWTHFQVRTADARLDRPEYIGGGSARIDTVAIPQTSATGLTGGSTPAGSLSATGAAAGTGQAMVYSATEHGYIYVFACATADLTYQQGRDTMWNVSTRYDWPDPLFSGLGEQAVLTSQIYCDGSANDAVVFGYIPRYDDYRSINSSIHGVFKSTAAGTLDYWHSSQKFPSAPTLNSTWIQDDARTVTQRNFAAGAATVGQQLLCDFFLDITAARPLTAYGVPGLTRL